MRKQACAATQRHDFILKKMQPLSVCRDTITSCLSVYMNNLSEKHIDRIVPTNLFGYEHRHIFGFSGHLSGFKYQ